MKFKNRGMIEEEGIYHCGKKLEPVLSSMYLGIALQTTGTAFSVRYRTLHSGYKGNERH